MTVIKHLKTGQIIRRTPESFEIEGNIIEYMITPEKIATLAYRLIQGGTIAHLDPYIERLTIMATCHVGAVSFFLGIYNELREPVLQDKAEVYYKSAFSLGLMPSGRKMDFALAYGEVILSTFGMEGFNQALMNKKVMWIVALLFSLKTSKPEVTRQLSELADISPVACYSIAMQRVDWKALMSFVRLPRTDGVFSQKVYDLNILLDCMKIDELNSESAKGEMLFTVCKKITWEKIPSETRNRVKAMLTEEQGAELITSALSSKTELNLIV